MEMLRASSRALLSPSLSMGSHSSHAVQGMRQKHVVSWQPFAFHSWMQAQQASYLEIVTV